MQTLNEVFTGEETLWAAVADILESAAPLQTEPGILDDLESISFGGQDYVKLEDAAARLGLEWGQAPDGSRYLAKRQTVGEIPEGWNVPVLMYHAVGDEIWGYSDLFVSAASMEEQLQYLQENGYEAIWFSDLAHIEDYEKPVILTFDDGYDDNYTLLLPLLQKYHMKATIFMIAGDIGGPHKLTQPQLRELTQSGLVSIQSHGWSHKNMAAMGWPALVCELLRSKLALTLACGRVPTAVSYPNGKCTERTRTAAGWFYAYGVRTFDGTYLTGTDPLLIPRTAIPRSMTPEQFQAACQAE